MRDRRTSSGRGVSGLAGRTRSTLRNLAILARVGARHFEDDPALLAVQTLRRLPAPVRHGLAGAVAAGARLSSRTAGAPVVGTALAEFLADRPAAARASLAGVAPTRRSTRRLHAELAVALGDEPPADAPDPVRARALWRRGRIGEAITALPAGVSGSVGRQRARLESERAILEPGFRLVAAPSPRPTGAGLLSPPDGIRALHLLTNSLPWTQSGYSLRSHAVLQAQAAEGIAVEAVTRIGYPVTVGLPHAPDTDVVDGVRYRRLMPWSMADTQVERLRQTAALLAREAHRFEATVLHTTTHYPNAVVAAGVAATTGLPWVYEVRGQLEKTWAGSLPVHEQQEAHRSERYRLWHAREAELAREADHVVTLSRALRDDLVARGVPTERITIVPNAVDDALVASGADDDASPADARRRLGLPSGGFWVGTVSSIVAYEGLDLLLESVALLRGDGHDVRCAIVGDGVARAELAALTTRLGLDGVVVMPGRVARSEAPLWHRALDAFVVPRRDLGVCRTVTPLKPIEAMALGRPVVVSDLPALSEITVEPGSGLAFAPGDAAALATTLHTLYADGDLRGTLATRGREFAATRTWRAQAAAYRDIYERLRGTA
ncbi:glycosyltransferase family 4 protein [Terrabacter sp. MAHUQ-38]|uniref:glycosyltransferase family 4 protein n=1 Tax=unclassified Terrabacter TaxID=2630222 RepID=UPI00165E9B7B|nr:glycosyltransferase family 4 protein [Terrabacter sp. MAHUQ-38]MBC9821921.1 glycosyltransferase [Terrabacter sp. MAHUQ-38]